MSDIFLSIFQELIFPGKGTHTFSVVLFSDLIDMSYFYITTEQNHDFYFIIYRAVFMRFKLQIF